MAPECLNISKNGSYDPFKADIWSLGVSMFCFAYFIVPFTGESLIKLFDNI